MTSRALLCSLLVLLYAVCVRADTLVIAGHAQELKSPLVVEGEEILAPVGPSLRLLNARTSVNDSAALITTAGGSTLQFSANSPTAEVDGRQVRLSAAPRVVDGELYLPVRALAPWLGADVTFDPATRTVSLNPLLTVSYELRGVCVAIYVRSAAPLEYTSARLSDPPRLFFDFKNVSLGLAEQQVPVQEGFVDRLRLAQNSSSPPIVRLVMDLASTATSAVTSAASVSEEGCLVTILIGEAVGPLAPLPESPAPGPVKLLDLLLLPVSAEQSELTVVADGPLSAESDFDANAGQLTLRLQNGLNTLPAGRLGGVTDRVVERIAAVGSSTDPGTELVVTFRKDSGYLVRNDGPCVRVLMGTFSIADMVIVLDAGHGGHDTGAQGARGTCEKEVNLDIVLRAEKLLRGTGAKVRLTRSDDTFIPLDDRPALSALVSADAFISVHSNSSAARNSCSGTQTYYCTPQSAALAAAMHAELLAALQLKNGGVRAANFLVLRKNRAPAVLLEIAFINNEAEEKLLRSPDFRQKTAEAIVSGVQRYAASRVWRLRRAETPTMVAAGAAPVE